jgi:peptidoglycan/xylan/chitin deacetylase (PgdA/CDA1 family)
MFRESALIDNPIPWPNGARCAVAVTWDVDCDSSLHWYNPDTADTLMATQAAGRYDLIALPRIIEVMNERDLRQTFFFPGWCIERYPHQIEALLAAGHEIGLHGYLHERSNEMSAEHEAEALRRGVNAFVKYVGRKPRGWRAPSFAFSKHSLSFLLEHGFEYDSSLMGDDLPYAIENKDGRLLEFPIEWTLDDWPHYVHNRDFRYLMPISAPHRAIDVFRAEFEAAWLYGGLWISIWHPFVSGRPARLHAALGLIDEMRAKGGVWFARLDEICDHVQGLIRSGTWHPRVERLPLYVSPLPEFIGIRNHE